MVAWYVLVGPVLAFLVLRFGFLYILGFKPFDWDRDPVLAKEYFKLLLIHEGPRPEFWIREGDDLSYFWFSLPLSPGSMHKVGISSAWTRLPLRLRVESFHSLWRGIRFEMAQCDPRLRSLQMILWSVVVGPLEILVQFAQFVFDLFEFKNFPSLSFWAQVPLKKFQRFWFGEGIYSSAPVEQRRFQTPGSTFEIKRPWGWASLVGGVWVRAHREESHPSWEILFPPQAFYGYRSESSS